MPAELTRRPRTLAATLFLLQCALPSQSGEPVRPDPGPSTGVAMVHAPKARALDVGAPVDLGTWDDTYVLHEASLLLARRDKQWFRLSVRADARPAPWVEAPEPRGARIENHIDAGGTLWLIFGHGSYTPFAFDPARGKRLDFQVPGVAARLQSLVAVPHLGAMLVMVGSSTGSPATARRPGCSRSRPCSRCRP